MTLLCSVNAGRPWRGRALGSVRRVCVRAAAVQEEEAAAARARAGFRGVRERGRSCGHGPGAVCAASWVPG